MHLGTAPSQPFRLCFSLLPDPLRPSPVEPDNPDKQRQLEDLVLRGKRVAALEMDDDLAMERSIWRLFSAYTIAHNPLDPEVMYKRSLVKFCIDTGIAKPERGGAPPPGAVKGGGKLLMVAEVNVVHQSEASRHPEKKFLFSCFKGALVCIAQKLYQRPGAAKSAPAPLLHRLLHQRVLPASASNPRMPKPYDPHPVGPALRALGEFEAKFREALRSVFSFHARQASRYERECLGRHGSRPDLSAMHQALSFKQWLEFCATFNLSSGTGSAVAALTNVELAEVFRAAVKVELADRVGGLTFEEFWEALVRAALELAPAAEDLGGDHGGRMAAAAGLGGDAGCSFQVAAAAIGGDLRDPRLAPYRLLSLFRQMMANIENGVVRMCNGGHERQHNRGGEVTVCGGRATSSNTSALLRGAKEFQRLVMMHTLSDYLHVQHHRAHATSGRPAAEDAQQKQPQPQQPQQAASRRASLTSLTAAAALSTAAMMSPSTAHEARTDEAFRPLAAAAIGSGQHQQPQHQPQQPADDPWQPVADQSSGRTYFYNTRTRETAWERPVAPPPAAAPPPAPAPQPQMQAQVHHPHQLSVQPQHPQFGSQQQQAVYPPTPPAYAVSAAQQHAAAGEAPLVPNPALDTALFRATMQEDGLEIGRLLASGANPAATNAAGLTVVQLAKERNKRRSLAVLQGHGLH